MTHLPDPLTPDEQLLPIEHVAMLTGTSIGRVQQWARDLNAPRGSEGRAWFRRADVNLLRLLLVIELDYDDPEHLSRLIDNYRALDLPADFAGWMLLTEDLQLYADPDAPLAAINSTRQGQVGLIWLGPVPEPLPPVQIPKDYRVARYRLTNLGNDRHETAGHLLTSVPGTLWGHFDPPPAANLPAGFGRAIVGLAHLVSEDESWDLLTNHQLTLVARAILEMRQ